MSDLAIRAKELIDNNLYITIATSSDNQPWNTPVFADCDSKYNFYWSSWINAQHSQNIRNNSNIFFVIYDSTRALGTNHRQCLYIKASAA